MKLRSKPERQEKERSDLRIKKMVKSSVPASEKMDLRKNLKKVKMLKRGMR
jgi:hypothetical protein